MIDVIFSGRHRTAKCKVDDCRTHELLYRFEFNSVDYLYLCEKHVPVFLSTAISKISVINPKLFIDEKTKLSFISLIKKTVEELQHFKAYGAKDLEEKLIEKLGE